MLAFGERLYDIALRNVCGVCATSALMFVRQRGKTGRASESKCEQRESLHLPWQLLLSVCKSIQRRAYKNAQWSRVKGCFHGEVTNVLFFRVPSCSGLREIIALDSCMAEMGVTDLNTEYAGKLLYKI
jgi:hypothetical protein